MLSCSVVYSSVKGEGHTRVRESPCIPSPTHPSLPFPCHTHLQGVLGHGVEDVEERLGREFRKVRELEGLLLEVVALGKEELWVSGRGACVWLGG